MNFNTGEVIGIKRKLDTLGRVVIPAEYNEKYIEKSKIKEKIEELDKQRIKMEQDDIGVGFTLGNNWSDLKAKIQVLQELMEDK